MMLLSILLPLLTAIPSTYAQTVYLAGDSTMALNGAGSGTGTNGDFLRPSDVSPKLMITLGWGEYLAQFLTIPVVNKAVGGTSARSYSEQGRFTTIINAVKSGDFVVIEFGHNDVSAGAVDNGKQDAVGDGYDITSTVTTSK